MSEVWPQPSVPWQYPGDSDEETGRWQDSINHALEAGTLHLEKVSYHRYELRGACPRCGHPLPSETIATQVIVGVEEVSEPTTARTNIDCNCTGPHTDAPKDRLGCGWGGPIGVDIDLTKAVRSQS
jgi:hypothetical protein